MHVSSAPYFDRRLSAACSFLAPLKSIKARRADGTDRMIRYQTGLADFQRAISKRVMGDKYFSITGELVPNSIAIDRDKTGQNYLIRGDLYAPVGCSSSRLQAVIIDEWAASNIAAGAIFFRSQPYGGWSITPYEGGTSRRGWWQRTFGDGTD